MPKSLLTRDIAQKAVAVVRPAILAAMEDGWVKRKALHIVVLDPTNQAILYEESLGDDPRERPYNEFALAKAKLAAREQLDTRAVLSQRPHLLREGDIKYIGGVFFMGIAVGVSGIAPDHDEIFAYQVAAAIRGLLFGAISPAMADLKEAYF